tara:strand:- start:10871 stop:11458 length:588 start_codon:yes stop_codon:yes gene_type:complete
MKLSEYSFKQIKEDNMLRWTIISLIFNLSFNAFAMSKEKSLYDFKLNSSKGTQFNLSDYQGKTILLVNIATKCGYTPQLDGLEELYAKYKQKNFVIIGIPSNDFGGQTPENSEDAAKFCRLKYGVSFPITKKYVVSGEGRTDLFKYIESLKGKGFDISWNFEKFLFDKNGKLVESFKSSTKPMSDELTSKIESIL